MFLQLCSKFYCRLTCHVWYACARFYGRTLKVHECTWGWFNVSCAGADPLSKPGRSCWNSQLNVVWVVTPASTECRADSNGWVKIYQQRKWVRRFRLILDESTECAGAVMRFTIRMNCYVIIILDKMFNNVVQRLSWSTHGRIPCRRSLLLFLIWKIISLVKTNDKPSLRLFKGTF